MHLLNRGSFGWGGVLGGGNKEGDGQVVMYDVERQEQGPFGLDPPRIGEHPFGGGGHGVGDQGTRFGSGEEHMWRGGERDLVIYVG